MGGMTIVTKACTIPQKLNAGCFTASNRSRNMMAVKTLDSKREALRIRSNTEEITERNH